MADYPQEVVEKICDPRTGIATRCKFLPTIAEIAEALGGHMLIHNRNWREEWKRKQYTPRSDKGKPTPEELERVRKIHDSLKSLGTFDPIEELRKEARAKRAATRTDGATS